MNQAAVADDQRIVVIYDGDCPFCRNYVALLRLRELTAGRVRLVDARDDPKLVHDLYQQGYDLDLGMLVRIGRDSYFGSDAIHMLSLLSGRSGALRHLNWWIFRSRRAARILYPIMRSARNLILWLLGRPRLRN